MKPRSREMPNVTINDIARCAGVSKATVSRVLNHPDVVDEKTRKTVQRVMEEQNYRPSVTARNLSNRKSSTIGVILPQVDNMFFGEMLRGMIHVADKNELTIMCFNSDDSKKKDLQTLEILAGHRVRGLIYVPAVSYEEKNERKLLNRYLRTLDAPVVIADRNIDLPVDGVFFDDNAAMYEATCAVIEAGHTRIAIINGTQERVLGRQRQSGFERAVEEAGLTIPEEYIMLGDYSIQSAYMMTKEMMKLPVQPTAVITCNNDTTKGFLEAVYESGRSIPLDYKNVSLYKMEMLNILGIPYNYIERDAYQMGQKAMEQLINRIAFPDRAYRHIIIESPFVKQSL